MASFSRIGNAQTSNATPTRLALTNQQIVSRSDVVLLRPNVDQTEAMPLGNGRLGLAVWAENGYTVQLNREDTWPFRKSPGHITIPSLRKLTTASDYSARLDLYNGEFVETGGGIKAVTWVDEKHDVMVVEVSGINPSQVQHVELSLWPGRKPILKSDHSMGSISETWRDTEEMGASGLTFGSLSALRVAGRGEKYSDDAKFKVTSTFLPKPDGTFQVYVAAPEWHGGDALGTAEKLFEPTMRTSEMAHRESWHKFWQSAALIALSSPDGLAQYFENLRTIDLFVTAAESKDRYPGNQAGIGDLFSSFGDAHHWGPSAYWHWNLRMQVSANLGAGLASFNAPYFNLYNDNMDAVAEWTRAHMGGKKGLCVPETMRFNGPGYENETWLKSPGINCSVDSRPYYNARTISTGAEVALWAWQQYVYTDDKMFLESYYPFMRESARFLLEYARNDPSGKLFTYPSNAHESNWDVRNPTTDISAMQALFPVVIKAATVLGIQDEDEIVTKVRASLSNVPLLPIRNADSTTILKNFDYNTPNTVIANSYTNDAIRHNEENIGLEPVWPYGLIGDDGPLHELGVRTFTNRSNKSAADWSADPVQAARLGLADEMKSTLTHITERYQFYPSGLAQLTAYREFYVEQIGVVADALQNALVQDYDGKVRINSAMPSDWDADGTVVIEHGNRVHVQVRQGKLIAVALECIRPSNVKLRNPWPNQQVRVSSGEDGSQSKETADSEIDISMRKGDSILIQRVTTPNTLSSFAPLSSVRSEKPKHLGSRIIGLEKSTPRPAEIPLRKSGADF
jgi:alpha-L-fucosidase 2